MDDLLPFLLLLHFPSLFTVLTWDLSLSVNFTDILGGFTPQYGYQRSSNIR